MPGQNAERQTKHHPPKISIIGAGMVGASLAYSLVVERVAGEIVLVDVNRDRAEGEAKDIAHAVPFSAPTLITSGDYDACLASDVVVITSGVAQKVGETRLDLVGKNVAIFREILPRLERVAPNAILLIVSNPVDILTYATLKLSSYPRERVIGAGTVLDTARFRHELGRLCSVDPRNVHAYVIGEHGDSEVPVWSLANVAGIAVKPDCGACRSGCGQSDLDRVFETVKNAAYDIIRLKGATYFAVALGTTRMVEAIVRDQNTVVTASTLLEGQYGIRDVCLSLPLVLGRGGIVRVLDIPLAPNEIAAMERSAHTLQEVLLQLELHLHPR
ncbi:MAG: L-lactate dehydrogenase [Deltaproteobacteria bacterium]|nr:L-lactate dehydrogenase [Deltaproteobacteria bacterium]